MKTEGSNLESHAHVDSGVKEQRRSEGTGRGPVPDWQIGTGRCPEGQMADAGRALVPGPGQDTAEITREELEVWALV